MKSYIENNLVDYTNKIKNHIRHDTIYDTVETLKVQHDKKLFRNLTFERLKNIINSNIFCGINMEKDYEKYFAIFDHMHLIDGSLSIKLGVNFGLFGFSITKLGTTKHLSLIDELVKGKIFGCFSMTELSHGSDVKNIRTNAIYDSLTNKFIINTGELNNRKFWIGNAYLHATHSVVFAQLYVNNICEGVHAFIVPLRNNKGKLYEGIYIDDCGTKLGLNGVDNGMICFNNVEIPYDNLLDKSCSIVNGQYISLIKSIDKRFSTMLSALTIGRVALSSGSLQCVKKSLYIALKYSLQRKQFFSLNKEVEIINYHNVQDRLIISLSKFFLYTGIANHLKKSIKENKVDYIHKISSGFKPIITWFCLDCLQKCRESCGGFGYDIENEIGLMRNDIDIYTTFEGDNHILLQQLAKILLGKYGKKYQNKTQIYDVLITNYFTKLSFDWTLCDFLDILKYKFLNKMLYILKILQKESKNEKNYINLWNNHQRELTDLSKYYIDYKTFKISLNEIKNLEDNTDKIIILNMYYLVTFKWILDNKYYLINKKLADDKIIRNISDNFQICMDCTKDKLEYILDSFNIPRNLFSNYLMELDENIHFMNSKL